MSSATSGNNAHLNSENQYGMWDVGIQASPRGGQQESGETQHYKVQAPTIADAIVNASATFGLQNKGKGNGDLSFEIVSCERTSSPSSMPGSSSKNAGDTQR